MRKLALVAALVLFGCPKPPAYPECRDDGDCKDHAQVCVSGTCRECRDDAQCAQKPGTVCRDNACVQEAQCRANSDCPQGQKCAQNKCVPECTPETQEQDCGRDRVGWSGRCADETCKADADCSSGKACVNGICRAQGAANATASCELRTVYFGFDDASLSQEARASLDAAMQCLKTQPGRIRIEGNTDERGSTEYNVALGERRAESVKKYLVGLGADASRLRTISYGEERPASDGHDEAAWAKNRRVEMHPEGGR
jgi:peptidoglycan-associated lipoprotein